jgi:hypothetical protein
MLFQRILVVALPTNAAILSGVPDPFNVLSNRFGTPSEIGRIPDFVRGIV